MENKSQIEELQMTPKELWQRRHRIGDHHEHVAGAETPLGHAYSIILEELAEKGLDSNPKPGEFLDYIKDYLRGLGMYHKVGDINLMEKCWCSTHSDAVLSYMKDQGLDSSSCAKIMAEIVGPDIFRYSKDFLEDIL